MEYLLDTDTCISYLRDKFNVARKIEAVGIQNCYVSEITIAELTFGAFHSKNYEKHITEVKKVELLYDVVPIYPQYRTLRPRKKPIEERWSTHP